MPIMSQEHPDIFKIIFVEIYTFYFMQLYFTHVV